MANLGVFGEIKEELISKILSDESIARLITNDAGTTAPARSLLYANVFPWAYVPDTTAKAQTFVTMEAFTRSVQNCAVKTVDIAAYVFTHVSLMKVDAAVRNNLGLSSQDKGSRVDVLCDKIDYAINGSTDFGFGKLELVACEPFAPIDDYKGRILRYRVQVRNRIGDKL